MVYNKTMNDQDGDWNYHLRILSNSARDSTDPASDPSVLQSVSNSARDSTDPASDPSVLQSVSIEQFSLDFQRNHLS